MLKTIREEPTVTEALKKAGNVYPRVWDAFDAMCWMLAHRELYGASLTTIRDVYRLHKQAAGGYGVPEITVIYTVSEEIISLYAIKIG